MDGTLIAGFVFGAFWIISLFVAFMIGYGWNNQTNEDEEES